MRLAELSAGMTSQPGDDGLILGRAESELPGFSPPIIGVQPTIWLSVAVAIVAAAVLVRVWLRQRGTCLNDWSTYCKVDVNIATWTRGVHSLAPEQDEEAGAELSQQPTAEVRFGAPVPGPAHGALLGATVFGGTRHGADEQVDAEEEDEQADGGEGDEGDEGDKASPDMGDESPQLEPQALPPPPPPLPPPTTAAVTALSDAPAPVETSPPPDPVPSPEVALEAPPPPVPPPTAMPTPPAVPSAEPVAPLPPPPPPSAPTEAAAAAAAAAAVAAVRVPSGGRRAPEAMVARRPPATDASREPESLRVREISAQPSAAELERAALASQYAVATVAPSGETRVPPVLPKRPVAPTVQAVDHDELADLMSRMEGMLDAGLDEDDET